MDTSTMRHSGLLPQAVTPPRNSISASSLTAVRTTRVCHRGQPDAGDQMAVGCCRAGPAARSEQASRTLCGRPERIRKLGERLCLVFACDKKFARYSPTPGSVGVRTDLHPVDARTDHQGEAPSATLEGAESSSNPTAWRRESAMRAWFVPPSSFPFLSS